MIFGIRVRLCIIVASAGRASYPDSVQVGLIGVDALLVALEAIDALELLVAVGAPPYCFVRVREEMTT